jgi:hypothetical protein
MNIKLQMFFCGENVMKMWKLTQAFFVVFILTAVNPSCRRDPVLDELNRLKEKAKAEGYSDVQQHSELALSKWQNNTVDPEPILITSHFGNPIDNKHIYLGLITFDEDKDVFGLGISEEYIDANGLKHTLTEEYPVFVYRMKPEVLDLHLFPVQIRDVNQRKDSQQWDKYIKNEGIDVNMIHELNYWRKSLPPVLISIPEPNTISVHTYIFDQTGHKSDTVKLLPPNSGN